MPTYLHDVDSNIIPTSVRFSKIPRFVHKDLNVPVMKLPAEPKLIPPPVPTMPAGKAPKTKIPIGYTRPILCSHTPIVDRAYMG